MLAKAMRREELWLTNWAGQAMDTEQHMANNTNGYRRMVAR